MTRFFMLPGTSRRSTVASRAFRLCVNPLAAASSVLAPLALMGCQGCKNDHPYVPYAIAEASSATPAVEDASLPDAADDAAPSERKAAEAPPEATEWTLEGLHLVAPADRVFALGTVADFDGDGAPDALCVVRGRDANDPGELYFYKGAPGMQVGPATSVAPPPPVPGDPACSASRRLARIGAHAAFVELGLVCPSRATGVPSRWIAVVTVARAAAQVRLSALVVDPPFAPKLTVDAESSDLDHDGIDDVAFRVTVEGGGAPFEPGPRLSAQIRWLDRSAGLSRQPDEPEASLRAISSSAMTRAAKSKDAVTVPLVVHQLRLLYASICAEGGAPRLTRVLGGHPIQCGQSRALEEAGLAEARAYATLGDPTRAVAALDRASLAPATRTPARVTEAQGWIAQSVPSVQASTLRAIAAIPLIDRSRGPSWGALSFEASGKVLVRTPAGVARVDPETGDEAEAGGVAAWKSNVLSPDGALRFIEAYDPCDAFALEATFAPTAAGDEHDVVLPVAARLGARCAGSRGQSAHVLPIAWGGGGLEALVAGEPVLVSPDLTRAVPLTAPSSQPVTPGAPRSPDGKTLVVPTTMGLLVRGARNRFCRAKELDGAYGEVRDCAVSDDGMRVACVRGGRAFVGIWDAP
jgi:hypothetical protein